MDNRGLQQPDVGEQASSQTTWFTGTLRHIWRWLGATGNHQVYVNPVASESADTAIYCVHGTADRDSAFSLMAERLTNGYVDAKASFQQLSDSISGIYLPAFDHRAEGVGIEEYARQLLAIIQANGHKKIILMGHSRGGLICSYFAEYLAKEAGIEVVCVMPLASPFDGSDKSVWPLTQMSTSVAQMTVGSDFLNALNEKIKSTETIYYPFGATLDEFVTPRSACPAGWEHHLHVLETPHSHLSMLSSWKLVDQVHKRVDQVHKGIINEDCSLSLQNLKNELQRYRKNFNAKWHVMFSPAVKDAVFGKLDNFIQELIDGKSTRYPEAKTMGEFLECFLSDTTLAIPTSSVAPSASIRDILATPLNFFFQVSNTTSVNFMESLCLRYKDFLLEREAREQNEISSPDSQLSSSLHGNTI